MLGEMAGEMLGEIAEEVVGEMVGAMGRDRRDPLPHTRDAHCQDQATQGGGDPCDLADRQGDVATPADQEGILR